MDFDTVVNEAIARAAGHAVPERVRARFAKEPELDEKATKEAGKPVFRMSEFIYMLVPGDSHQKKFRVSEQHRRRFAKEWHWFLDNEKEITEGQPIEEWNQITRSVAAELKWSGITTVEKLAAWDLDARPLRSDHAALVALAQDYLAGQDEKDKQIAALEAEIEQLRADKPKRGRPKKVADDDIADDGASGGGRAGDPVAVGGSWQ